MLGRKLASSLALRGQSLSLASLLPRSRLSFQMISESLCPAPADQGIRVMAASCISTLLKCYLQERRTLSPYCNRGFPDYHLARSPGYSDAQTCHIRSEKLNYLLQCLAAEHWCFCQKHVHEFASFVNG